MFPQSTDRAALRVCCRILFNLAASRYLRVLEHCILPMLAVRDNIPIPFKPPAREE